MPTSPTSPAVIADLTYNRLLYGPSNIAGTAVAGTTASVSSLTLDDVKSFYNTYYAPNVSSLVVVGDVDQAALAPQLGFLKNWAKKDVTIPADLAGVQPDKTTRVLREQARRGAVRNPGGLPHRHAVRRHRRLTTAPTWPTTCSAAPSTRAST